MNSSNKIDNRQLPLSKYAKLRVQYGSDQYEIHISNKNEPVRMINVIEEIERVIKVPKCHQKIIYKGQRLDHRPQANLNELHLFNNSKLYLWGTQQQYHDKYCCPDHDHRKEDYSKIKPTYSHEQTKSKCSTENVDPSTSSNSQQESNSTQSTIKQLDEQSKPENFVPEPDKIYEYYSVPYRSDPKRLIEQLSFTH